MPKMDYLMPPSPILNGQQKPAPKIVMKPFEIHNKIKDLCINTDRLLNRNRSEYGLIRNLN